MARISASLFLLMAFAFCLHVQGQMRQWASAREHRLKGRVSTLVVRCASDGGRIETKYKYEFDRDGKLTAITAFQRPATFVPYPGTYKIIKRDSRGGPAEAASFIGDILERTERYEVEYDGVGNWTKWVTHVMRDYEIEGAGTAGKWLLGSVCHRSIEYHP